MAKDIRFVPDAPFLKGSWIAAAGNVNEMWLQGKSDVTFDGLPHGIQLAYYFLPKGGSAYFGRDGDWIWSSVPFLVIHTEVCRLKTSSGFLTSERPERFSISIKKADQPHIPRIKTPQFVRFPGRRTRYINLLRLGEFMAKGRDEMVAIFKQYFELADQLKLFVSCEGRIVRVLEIMVNGLMGRMQRCHVDENMWAYRTSVVRGSKVKWCLFDERNGFAWNLERIHIPAGWAMNVLYLEHFGYKPRI